MWKYFNHFIEMRVKRPWVLAHDYLHSTGRQASPEHPYAEYEDSGSTNAVC